jgi:hypothetical protein
MMVNVQGTMQGTMQTPNMTLVHGISYRCLKSHIENAILFRQFGFVALKIV